MSTLIIQSACDKINTTCMTTFSSFCSKLTLGFHLNFDLCNSFSLCLREMASRTCQRKHICLKAGFAPRLSFTFTWITRLQYLQPYMHLFDIHTFFTQRQFFRETYFLKVRACLCYSFVYCTNFRSSFDELLVEKVYNRREMYA